MTFYAIIKCSWPSYPQINLALEAVSASVAVAQVEAWVAGFQCGTEQHVTLTLSDLTSKKPRGVNFFPMYDWSAIKTGVHHE